MATAFDQQRQEAGSSQGDAPRAGPGGGGGGARFRRNGLEEEEAEESGQRRGAGRKKALRDAEDIPVVKDQTGERVKESFVAFLEGCA